MNVVKREFRVRLSRVGEVHDAMPNYQNSYHACCNKDVAKNKLSFIYITDLQHKSVLH